MPLIEEEDAQSFCSILPNLIIILETPTSFSLNLLSGEGMKLFALRVNFQDFF